MSYKHQFTSGSWVSSNGLQVMGRTSQTVLLSWETVGSDKDKKRQLAGSRSTGFNDTLHKAKSFSDIRVGTPAASVSSTPGPNKAGPSTLAHTSESTIPDEVDQWYEVQMRPSNERDWKTVYEGFGKSCTVTELAPNTNLSFRMRKNGDEDWGSTIVAATQAAPPTAEDLHRAIHCNASDIVLRVCANSKQANIKAVLCTLDKTGLTPLQIAALNGNHEICGILINAGAQVNAISPNTGKTALMMACFKGSFPCVQLLDRNGADWTIKDASGCTAIHHAITGGQVRTLDYALDKSPKSGAEERDNNGWTPLMRAVIVQNSLDLLKMLVMRGVNVNSTDKNNTKSVLMAASLLRKADMMDYLLQNRADPKYVNSNGQTVVTISKSIGSKKVIELLKKYGLITKSEMEAALRQATFD